MNLFFIFLYFFFHFSSLFFFFFNIFWDIALEIEIEPCHAFIHNKSNCFSISLSAIGFYLFSIFIELKIKSI